MSILNVVMSKHSMMLGILRFDVCASLLYIFQHRMSASYFSMLFKQRLIVRGKRRLGIQSQIAFKTEGGAIDRRQERQER